jgi:hypothetical protein
VKDSDGTLLVHLKTFKITIFILEILKKYYKCKYQYWIILTQIKVKEQLVVRKDTDVNEHERLSNITLRHKLK